MLEDFKQGIKFEFATDSTQCYGKDMREIVKELNGYLTKLSNIYTKEQNNFAELCYYVYKVHELFYGAKREKLYYGRFLTKGRDFVFFETIMKNFGIDETQSSRLISCYERYVAKETEKPILLAEFFSFSKSKLFDLITVPVEQLKIDIQNKVLRPEMSVLQIREYVKNYKAQQKQNKKLQEKEDAPESYDEPFNEAEIEMAYDPKKHYEFQYFESKSKSQLLNIIMQLQNEYEKLKMEKK